MGKKGKWLRNFLLGKKDKDNINKNHPTGLSTTDQNPSTPTTIIQLTTPKEKKRWSFRRSSGSKDPNSKEDVGPATPPIAKTPAALQAMVDGESEQRKHALAVAVATAAAADAAVAAAQAASAVLRLTDVAANDRASVVEEAAAVKIQSVFRSYLARKALSALKGLVKLQALVRGHLVRKQATATLRCMQALVTVQARALAQRIRMAEEEKSSYPPRQSTHRKATQDSMFNFGHDTDRISEDSIKIVEMDHGVPRSNSKNRKSYSNNSQNEHRFSTYDDHQTSPAPSAVTDMSPRACSGHFEDYSFTTAQSSPQCHSAMSRPDSSRVPFSFHRPDYPESLSYEYPFFPSYMANTESSRAKVRSQSAPKQRPESFERQPSYKRRPSMEGRNIPRAVRMQRSSSQVGAAVQGYQYPPWSNMKLDRSSVSLKESECGSTSTVLTNTNYCQSLVSFDPQGRRY